MTLIVLAIAVVILLVLIGLKVDAFIALLMTSFITGVLNGMGPEAALKSLLKGLGDTVGSLGLIILFGAMLGKLIEESGAAHTIANALTKLLGLSRVQLALVITAFLVGLAMFFQPAFFILIPLVYTLSTTTGLPLMYLAIPFCAALSVTHGYLPPHPGVTAVAVVLHADVNRTLLYGLIISIPATIVAGPLLAMLFRGLRVKPPARLFRERTFSPGELPGLGVSLISVLFPVLIMLAGAVVTLTIPAGGGLMAAVRFFSEPNVVLFLAVVLGFYTLGLRRGRSLEKLMKESTEAVSSVAPVLFVIAGGGAFKQVLLDGGTGEAVRQLTTQVHVSPDRARLGHRGAAARGRRFRHRGGHNRRRNRVTHRAGERGPARTSGPGHRCRQHHFVALQRLGLLDVQGVLRPQHQADPGNLDRDGSHHRSRRISGRAIAEPTPPRDLGASAGLNVACALLRAVPALMPAPFFLAITANVD